MTKLNNGCSYGKVNRNMIENLGIDFREFKEDIKAEFKNMNQINQKLYNHLSSRLPPWATAIGAIGIALFSGILGVLIASAF